MMYVGSWLHALLNMWVMKVCTKCLSVSVCVPICFCRCVCVTAHQLYSFLEKKLSHISVSMRKSHLAFVHVSVCGAVQVDAFVWLSNCWSVISQPSVIFINQIVVVISFMSRLSVSFSFLVFMSLFNYVTFVYVVVFLVCNTAFTRPVQLCLARHGAVRHGRVIRVNREERVPCRTVLAQLR